MITHYAVTCYEILIDCKIGPDPKALTKGDQVTPAFLV